jgi:ribosome-binding protein aMBF1 (putative translation factor)
MVTTQQVAAAHAFLVACEPANALRQKPATQNQRTWQGQFQAAKAARSAARTATQDLCGTRAVYQEAIAAARERRKLA